MIEDHITNITVFDLLVILRSHITGPIAIDTESREELRKV